jgi:hypothetical protein
VLLLLFLLLLLLLLLLMQASQPASQLYYCFCFVAESATASTVLLAFSAPEIRHKLL